MSNADTVDIDVDIDNVFDITTCNLAQIIAESNRFLFHISLIHIATSIIEDKKEIFNETLFKTLLITSMAILMYHVFFRKLVEPKVEKMKIVCGIDDVDAYYNKQVKQKIQEENLAKPAKQNNLDKQYEWSEYHGSAQTSRSVCEKYGRYRRYRRDSRYSKNRQDRQDSQTHRAESASDRFGSIFDKTIRR